MKELKKTSNSLIYMGKCSKPHGIKGAFHFHLLNPEQSTLGPGSRIWVASKNIPEGGQWMIIERITFGHKVMAYLEGVNGRNEVEALLPFEIYQERSDFPEPEEGEYYLEDLKGLKAIDLKSGEQLGVVRSFYDNGAQDVMVIRPKSGPMIELPMVEAFFHEINWEEQTVTVTKPQWIGER